ncbi:MAG: helix-turn-helix domain-containing protein [Clostridia bacterium]|nr:helix-turn-helix domain-containing protein [Clostridia bacterium]
MEKETIKIRFANAIQKIQFDLPTLAKQLGISQKLLESYVKGEKLPPVVVFANICEILDLDANKVMNQ